MKSEFLTAISQLASEKGVSRDVALEALEQALVSGYKKSVPHSPSEVTAQIDPNTGSVRIFATQTVVAEAQDGNPDVIPLAKARERDPNVQVGDQITVDITPSQRELGRIAAQTAKQVLLQKLRDAERKRIYEEFAESEGEIKHGVVVRLEQGNAIVELGRAEALLPKSEQVPTERYYPGQRLRVYVSEVHDTHRGPQIIVSRAHRHMLRRLLEQEVPEIYNGQVEIKAIAREAGYRSKVAVAARQEGIDPVGSVVGLRGVRIQSVVNELGGEKVDVVAWSEDPGTFVANALSPAQVLSVRIDEDARTATVVVPERQLSLAIGKEGQNARLAAKLTGWRIDIKSDTQAALEAQERERAARASAPLGAGELAPEDQAAGAGSGPAPSVAPVGSES